MINTVAQILLDKHNITAHPGAKVECVCCIDRTDSGLDSDPDQVTVSTTDSDTNQVTIIRPDREPIVITLAKKSQIAARLLDILVEMLLIAFRDKKEPGVGAPGPELKNPITAKQRSFSLLESNIAHTQGLVKSNFRIGRPLHNRLQHRSLGTPPIYLTITCQGETWSHQ